MFLPVASAASRGLYLILESTERLVDGGHVGGEIVIPTGQCPIKQAPDNFGPGHALLGG
jgi:hypothetical protein